MGSETICGRCQRNQLACCQTQDTFVTLGDVRRIGMHIGREDFWEFRPALDDEYTQRSNDPLWQEGVFRADGTRRVLLRRPLGECCFLETTGCQLPEAVRPLVCRLFPRRFHADPQSLAVNDTAACPALSAAASSPAEHPPASTLDVLRRWHRQLYNEIRAEAGLRLAQPSLHIGLTYDLRAEYRAAGYSEEETAEFDSEETIAAIEQALIDLGHTVERIGHARQLVTRLAQGHRWDGVFNVCEGLSGAGRESQVPAILDAFGIPYTFSDPLVMGLCLHKGLTKTVLHHAGLAMTPFHTVERVEQLGRLALRFPAFVKPVAEGTGKGVTPRSRVESLGELQQVTADLLSRYRQPVLIEPFLPGREFTVGILGTGADARVLGTLEIVLRPAAEAGVYSLTNKEQCESLVDYLPVSAIRDSEVERAERMALEAWQILGCRDGGRVDLRSDEKGQPQFLEVNPLAGLHPTHSDLPMIATSVGLPYSQLIGHILESAILRWLTDESCRSPQSTG